MALNMAETLRLEKLQRDFQEMQRLERLKADEDAKAELVRQKKAAMLKARSDWEAECAAGEVTRLEHNKKQLVELPNYAAFQKLPSDLKQRYISGLGEAYLGNLKAASEIGVSLRDYEKLLTAEIVPKGSFDSPEPMFDSEYNRIA